MMEKYDKAREEILKLNPKEEETPEEFFAKIMTIYAMNYIYSDFDWACKSSFMGGEG